jgi:hypothetical protein
MIPIRAQTVCDRFRAGGDHGLTPGELIGVLDEYALVIAFDIGMGMVRHMACTLNADYIMTQNAEDAPLSEDIDNIVIVYDVYKKEWVAVPIDKIINLYTTQSMEEYSR